MTLENKIYYETLFEEFKEELVDLIHKFNITKITLKSRGFRPTVSSPKGKDIINMFRSRESIYVSKLVFNSYIKLFEINLLKRDINNETIVENIYRLFCEYFQNLVEEVNNDR